MIRDYQAADIDQILGIWLSASVKGHSFIEPEFWKSMIGMMRDVYIPASETLVYEKRERWLVSIACMRTSREATNKSDPRL